MLKQIWIRINFFPRGKCIPVITGQRLLDRQESEGRMDGFRCQAIYYSSQTKSDLGFHIFEPKHGGDLPYIGINMILGLQKYNLTS